MFTPDTVVSSAHRPLANDFQKFFFGITCFGNILFPVPLSFLSETTGGSNTSPKDFPIGELLSLVISPEL